jgi:hypothetical protein
VLKRVGCWCLVVLATVTGLTAVRPLAAASLTLSPRDREEAIRLGKKSVITDEFGGEWTVRGDGPGQSLTVMTPFHRLALASRNSAFKNQELKPKDIETLLKEQESTLTVWATLKGGTPGFARFYTPMLVKDAQQIKASFAQNEHTARREDDGSYTARCLYVFTAETVKPNDKLVLIVKDPDDKAVAKFVVDLSSMR